MFDWNEGRVKIVDMGLAKLPDETKTKEGKTKEGKTKEGKKRAAPPPRAKQPKATIEAVLDEDLEAENVEASIAGGNSGGGGGSAPGTSAFGSGGGGGGDGGEEDGLAKVKARIRKMLSLGLHAETGEAEAEASMRMAEKLLSKHNLKQADVLDEDHVPEALKGGKSSVHLRSTAKERRPCQTKAWMHTLGNAVTRNFDCSYYFTSHTSEPPVCGFTSCGIATTLRPLPIPSTCSNPLPSPSITFLVSQVCDFTFYGIATNASLAAFAFAAAFNRIAILTAAHTVPAAEFEGVIFPRPHHDLTTTSPPSRHDIATTSPRHHHHLATISPRSRHDLRCQLESLRPSGGVASCLASVARVRTRPPRASRTWRG